MKIKDKILNIFLEEDNSVVAESVVRKSKSLTLKYILSFSVVLNLIMNILYINLICYRTSTNVIGMIWLFISLIWSLVSLFAAYRLADDVGNNIFYFNVILLYLMSKMWFVFI
jgi:hypothetical protein